MKYIKLFKASLIYLTLISLMGCASNLHTTQSGFLQDYSKLEESAKFDNTKIYMAPSFDKQLLARSKKIKVEPFEIWINQQPESTFNPEQLVELSHYFQQQFINKLQPNYQIMEHADKDTLIIRGAFSGIKLNKPKLKVGDFVPIRMVINAGNAAYLMASGQHDLISEVSIEAEFVTGKPLHRVFAMTTTKQLDTTIAKDGKENTKAVKQVLDVWVDNFVTTLEKI